MNNRHTTIRGAVVLFVLGLGAYACSRGGKRAATGAGGGAAATVGSADCYKTEGAAPCEHVRATLTKRLLEVDARMADLRALRRTLEAALDWSRELPLAESCVCGIIESQPMPATKPLPAFRHRRSASR